MSYYKSWSFDQIQYRNPQGKGASGTGALSVSADGRVEIEIQLPQHVQFLHSSLRIVGKAPTGHELVAEASLTKLDFGTATRLTFRPLWAKIFEPGVSQTTPLSWDAQVWHLKNAKLVGGAASKQVGAFKVDLDPKQFSAGAEAQAGEMTLLMSITVPTALPVDDEEAPTSVCRLLSLAQRCPIVPVIKERRLNNKLILTELHEQTWDHLAIRPLADWFTQDTLNFVSAAYSGYCANRDKYALPILIDYYWRSHVESIAELKFLFASVFMEALKFNWAANVATNLEPDLKANGLVRGYRKKGGPATGKGKFKNLSFEDLLDGVCQELGYVAPPGTFSFIEDRNCIFHSGLSRAHQQGHPSSWPIIKPELQKLYNQLDDLLLRILGYSGVISPVDFVNPNRRVTFPARTPVR